MQKLYKFDNNTSYLIAEIGGNHEGSFEKAKEQCELAIESGADCIKFQLYSANGLVNPKESPDRHAHFGKFELSKEEHITLAQMCIDAGRDYLASVWELEMLEWIDPYLKHYKIGSGDLTATTLLRAFAKKGKPIILSTGLSNFEEISNAVEVIRSANPAYKEEGMLSLLQCTSMYPIANTDANLEVIKSLNQIPNITVGYSDHTVGLEALVTSVAVGARILEFHFTDKREGQEFRDHKVSLMVDEVLELRKRINSVMELLGSSKKEPMEIELSTDHVTSFRRALYPSKDLLSGTIVTEEDLVSLRPNHGIGAEYLDDLVGKKLTCDVQKNQKLSWDMFEE